MPTCSIAGCLRRSFSTTPFPISGQNKSNLLIDLSRYVSSRGLKGLTTVLIVDEAHQLSMELLEEIRLLSNLETNDDKLLQIVLVGQPELDEKLDSFELRPLKQRIALRAHLASLDADETQKYIAERLRLAGSETRSTPIFSEEAIHAVHHNSRGFPRLINTICENDLIAGYARIKEVADDFRLNSFSSTNGKKVHDQTDLELERAKNLFLDLYAAVKKSGPGVSDLDAPLVVEAGEHE